jgi:cytochrome bd ubiquinol oxidase subunit II
VTLELAVVAAMFVGVVVYALFGGADFGSGFYDLTAGGSARGAALRTRIDRSIGPVWEANHVWLIYVLVTWWTAFPVAFAQAMNTLIVPMFLALLGIILRGASFAFRKYAETLAQARLFGAIFALSSVVTPFFLGAVAGAIASGRVPASGRGELIGSWVNPTSLFGGVIAVGTCAFLAGVFLCADADRAEESRLVAVLRTRTLSVGLVTGAIVFAALVPLEIDAPTLADGLETRAAPLIVLSFLAGVLTLWLLWTRRFALARPVALVAVAAVVFGWGVAQYPWLLVDEMTIVEAAGARATLQGVLVAAGIAAALVLPSLAYLYRLTQTEAWTRPDH